MRSRLNSIIASVGIIAIYVGATMSLASELQPPEIRPFVAIVAMLSIGLRGR